MKRETGWRRVPVDLIEDAIEHINRGSVAWSEDDDRRTTAAHLAVIVHAGGPVDPPEPVCSSCFRPSD
jgi:hypothetical protein